jgi:glutamate racemase
MNESRPVFIADSCIGGLSVVKSLWNAGDASDAVFLADYAINPLGVKSDSDIADVADQWLRQAKEHSDTLVMACNTLSVRYHELLRSDAPVSGPKHIVSMVDCFKAMVQAETARLADKKVLIIGTRYTAGQNLYPVILKAAVPNVRINTVAATELERAIARLEAWDSVHESVLTGELRRALDDTDVAVLACTCFPMVATELGSLFPAVTFLDPGAYCSGLLEKRVTAQNRKLRIKVTGDVVSVARTVDFAKSHLDTGDIECCIQRRNLK